MLKRLALAAFAIATFIGVAGATPVSAGIASTPKPQTACDGFNGVQYGSHLSFICLHRIAADGTLYWYPDLYTVQFYMHPNNGDMVVTETYYRSCSQIVSLGSTCPDGLPLPPRANGRIVTLADGCLVDAPSLGTVPTQCTPISDGGQVGSTRQMTTAEQDSVSHFWDLLHYTVKDSEW